MRWTLRPVPDQTVVADLATALNVEPLVAQLLVQRGVTTYEQARAFFRPQLTDLHDPFLMKDMDKAVDRVLQALAEGENILVYGDYDVDGTTSVALMSSFLSAYHDRVATYIPDRYEEGYGVSYQGIDFAHDNEITLIIALDCGIKAIDKVAYARSKGIDFIICDHHRPGNALPEAVAVLDPKREDCGYPYKELCGCGVGFKLIQALGIHWGLGIEDLRPYLDLVATAIAADIVPITGENRVLSFFGLEQINKDPRPGIRTIMELRDKKEFTNTDLVFQVAPRINAAGRMEHGRHAVALLTTADMELARIQAEAIEGHNTDRKDRDREITEQALAQIRDNREESRFTSVVYHPEWHKGVIGIVASRLTETFYRPTLVFTRSGDKLAASARSVKGFDVYEALEGCAEYIEQFGGHKYAAGLTLEASQYEAFKARFEEVVSRSIDKSLLVPEIQVDACISLKEITPRLYRILKQFAPFGPGNPSPLFMAERLCDTGFAKAVGSDGSHLKLSVCQGDSPRFGAIGFGLADKLDLLANRKPFDAVFSIEENEWNGNVSLQLRVRDLR